MDELNKSLETGKEQKAYSAGMMLSSRIMTSKLTDLLNKMPGSNTAVILINQATIDMDSYVKKDKSKGGNAKNHAIHLSLHFNFSTNKTEEREEKSFTSIESSQDDSIKKLTFTTLSVDKNKFGISEEKIGLAINNVDLSGRFVKEFEVISWCMGKEVLKSKGAYLQLNEKYIDKYKSDSLDLGKNWRFTEISKNPEFMSLLFKITEEYYRETSNSVDHLYKVKKAYMDKFDYKDIEID